LEEASRGDKVGDLSSEVARDDAMVWGNGKMKLCNPLMNVLER